MTRREKQLRRRHGDLVDKKFTSGLTKAEQRELVSVDKQLSEIEAPLYNPAIDALSKELAKLKMTLSRKNG